MITGSGRSAGESIGYPLQYTWAFLVTQLVKNPPAAWETWVRSLGWEDPFLCEYIFSLVLGDKWSGNGNSMLNSNGNSMLSFFRNCQIVF